MVSPLFGGPLFGEPLFGEGESQEPGVGITLDRLYIHIPDRAGTSSNASIGPLALINPPGQSRPSAHQEGTFHLKGRRRPLKAYGEIDTKGLRCAVIIESRADLKTLETIVQSRSIVCVRDQRGNLIFGKIPKVTHVEDLTVITATFDVEASEYAEAV